MVEKLDLPLSESIVKSISVVIFKIMKENVVKKTIKEPLFYSINLTFYLIFVFILS